MSRWNQRHGHLFQAASKRANFTRAHRFTPINLGTASRPPVDEGSLDSRSWHNEGYHNRQPRKGRALTTEDCESATRRGIHPAPWLTRIYECRRDGCGDLWMDTPPSRVFEEGVPSAIAIPPCGKEQKWWKKSKPSRNSWRWVRSPKRNTTEKSAKS